MRSREPWAPPSAPFTPANVAPMGVTPERIESALRAGVITRLRWGVYVATAAVPEDPVALHVLRALAEQVAAPGRVASHGTAALALGLPLLGTTRVAEGAVHLLRPASASDRSRARADRHIHLGSLPDHHVTTLPSGLVVTTAARTALDVAATVGLPEALMIADAAARLEFANLSGTLDRRHYENGRLRVAAALPLAEAVGHLVTPRARGLLSVLDLVDVRRESPLESFSAAHMHLAGLPAPRLQARVRTRGGTCYPDFLWEEYGVIGEADGEGKYADPRAFAMEKDREGNLRDLGLEVVRWTGREGFGTPLVVTERIARALTARGWSP